MNTISSRKFHLRLKSSWAVRAGKRSVKTDEIHARLDQPGSKHVLQKNKQTNKQYLNGRNREREDHRTGLENVWRVEEFLFYYSTISVAGSEYFFYNDQNSCIWKLKWLPNVHDISVIYCHWNIYISLREDRFMILSVSVNIRVGMNVLASRLQSCFGLSLGRQERRC